MSARLMLSGFEVALDGVGLRTARLQHRAMTERLAPLGGGQRPPCRDSRGRWPRQTTSKET